MRGNPDVVYRMPSDIPGYGTPQTCRALFELAREVREGWIVELGTFYGQGAACLLQGAFAGAAASGLMTIDHYQGEENAPSWSHAVGEYTPEDVLANLARYGREPGDDHIQVVKGRSWEIPEDWWRLGERVGLLYVDAAHDEDSAWRDFVVWETPMAEHGIIVYDDAAFPGVKAAVDRVCRTGRWCVREFMADDRIVVLTRR